MEDVRRVTSSCKAYAELKPRFFKPEEEPLIKATRPFERISLDFKGPLPSSSRNKYLLTVVHEFSRFPSAYPCPDMTVSIVKKCMASLLCLFGVPAYVHTDRGAQFMSSE